ncbi:MAG: hypothetical protein WBI17_05835 [Clostridiaceae bacterium]
MTVNELKKLEGRWVLQYSGCPMWRKTNIDTITFNYELQHRGEELVLREQVEFRRNGKMKSKRGYEIPSEDSDLMTWKGIGMNKLFRTHSKVLYNHDGILIMWFEKTMQYPESIDVLTRKKHLSAHESEYIFTILKGKDFSAYLDELESVNIL